MRGAKKFNGLIVNVKASDILHSHGPERDRPQFVFRWLHRMYLFNNGRLYLFSQLFIVRYSQAQKPNYVTCSPT